MKGVGFADNARAREILWKDGINPFTSRDNLAWGPNWSHSIEYAHDVYVRVRDGDAVGGANGVRKALKEIARLFIAGAYGKVDIGDTDDDVPEGP